MVMFLFKCVCVHLYACAREAGGQLPGPSASLETWSLSGLEVTN